MAQQSEYQRLLQRNKANASAVWLGLSQSTTRINLTIHLECPTQKWRLFQSNFFSRLVNSCIGRLYCNCVGGDHRRRQAVSESVNQSVSE